MAIDFEKLEDTLVARDEEAIPPSYQAIDHEFERVRVLTAAEAARSQPQFTFLRKLFARWACMQHGYGCIHTFGGAPETLTWWQVRWSASEGWHCRECKKPAEATHWWPSLRTFRIVTLVPMFGGMAALIFGDLFSSAVGVWESRGLVAAIAGGITLVIVAAMGNRE